MQRNILLFAKVYYINAHQSFREIPNKVLEKMNHDDYNEDTSG
jgi:hypothetical protein